VIGETYNEKVLALIHKIWGKTQNQTIMPEKNAPQRDISWV
jgi:hypothetical protein